MATMAAAIAASLPTVQAAPTPVAPTQENLPASWSRRIDAEAEISITTVQIDGLLRLCEFYQRTESLNDSRSPQKSSSTVSTLARMPMDWCLGSILTEFSKFPTVSRCRTNPPTRTISPSNLLVGGLFSSHGADVHAYMDS